jgi:hypothetical protein
MVSENVVHLGCIGGRPYHRIGVLVERCLWDLPSRRNGATFDIGGGCITGAGKDGAWWVRRRVCQWGMESSLEGKLCG